MSDLQTSIVDGGAELTPRQIVSELDKYIIGQDDAKKSVAIALRNRWRRLNAPIEMRDEIMPNNIIMIGPTGVGKTEIARRLAKLALAPFLKIEATKFTEVGYVGRDVESIIRDLTEISVTMIKEEHTLTVQDKARDHANERILDVLVPQPKLKTVDPSPAGFTLPSPEVDQADVPQSTRDKFRKKLVKGDLEDREIEIEVTGDSSPMLQVFGPMGMEEMGMNIQDLFGNMGGNKKKKRRLVISEARELLVKEEAQKLLDMDKITKEAINRVEQSGIVFLDEIDKVADRSSAGGGGPNVSREGVQRDLLPIVEGSGVNTKYGMVKSDHILFIASGAFHISKPSDLIPEFQGRFPIRVELDSLTESDFYKILTQPKNALLKQYAALLQTEGIELEFTDDAVKDVARIAAQVNADVENIGARRLHTILTTLLEEILFDVPDVIKSTHLMVDSEMVHAKLNSIVEDRDLSQFIL